MDSWAIPVANLAGVFVLAILILRLHKDCLDRFSREMESERKLHRECTKIAVDSIIRKIDDLVIDRRSYNG